MEKDYAPILAKLDALDAKVAGLETKVNGVVTREAFNITMDEVLTIVRRLDQERVFTLE